MAAAKPATLALRFTLELGALAAPKSSRRLQGAACLASTGPAWLAATFGAFAAPDTLLVHLLGA